MDMLDERLRSQQNAGIGAFDVIPRDCMIEVKNNTGADLDEWQVVGLGAATTPPSESEQEFVERHVLNAEVPASTHESKFAILQEAIPSGEIGRALVAGVTIARVDVNSTSDERAAVQASVYRLDSGSSGPCRILYAESTGDNQLALVLISSDAAGGMRLGKASAFIAKGTSGSCAIWSGPTVAGVVATGESVTAYARTTHVDSGKWVYLWKFAWGWEIVGKEC